MINKCLSKKILPIILAILLSCFAIPISAYANQTQDDSIHNLIEAGEYQKCIELIDNLLPSQPDNSYYYGQKGYALIELAKYDEALECLMKANTLKPNDDSILNNISWAYNNKDEYDAALKYSELALKITPDDPYSLCNKGDALLGLERYSEAVTEYTKAIKFMPKMTEALYGEAVAEFKLENYKASIEALNKYTKLKTTNTNSYLYLGMDYYYLGDTINSLSNLSLALKLDKDNVDALFYKGLCYYSNQNYKDALTFFNEDLAINPNDSDAYYYKCKTLYNQSNYKEALVAINKSISLDKDYSYSYSWKGKVENRLNNYKESLVALEKAITLDSKNFDAYEMKAIVLFNMGEDEKALAQADKNIQAFPDINDSYLDKIHIVYNTHKYDDCISLVEGLFKSGKLKGNGEALQYLAQSYSAIGNHTKAKSLFETLMKDISNDASIISNVAWEDYYLNNYETAMIEADKALKTDPECEDAKNLIDQIKYDKEGDNLKIPDFVKNNYLYIKSVENFENEAKVLKAKDGASLDDIANFLNKVILSNDQFTYLLAGQDYTDFISHENNATITTRDIATNCKLLSIPSFGSKIGKQSVDYLKSIKSPQITTLVIDLRDDSGGLMSEADKILDLLLPKCTIDYLEYNDGTKYYYYSDENCIKFKKIIIMVNENSASSAELLTLSLKKHLSNVTVIGHKTFGKGVGQDTFEDSKKKFILLLTSFKWYVENTNVMEDKITPDIIVNGSDDQSYYNYIDKEINAK